MAALIISAFLLSCLGLPVRRFAWPMTAGLALLAALVLWRLRPPVGLRRYAPFALVLLAALLIIGRPLFSYDFHWLSYCNDDMANYALIAQRLVDHGFYDVPGTAELVGGADYSQFFWFY